MPLMINARAEGLAEKPAYRWAFKYRRCLVPASGFYEWRDTRRGPKQPFLASCQPRERAMLFAFAGLWETWLGADGSEIDTAAIVTTDCQRISASAPRADARGARAGGLRGWLSADTTLKEAQALLKPAPEDFFALTPVSTRVNSADNDDPGLIERAEVQPSTAASPTDAAIGQLRLF